MENIEVFRGEKNFEQLNNEFETIDQDDTSLLCVTNNKSKKNKINKKLKDISITSYNCKNIMSNWSYVDKLMENSEIVFLQETWLDNDDQPDFESKYDEMGFNSTFKCTKACQTRDMGRPSGGVGWLVNKKLKTKIKIVNERISTCEIIGLEYKVILLGIYLSSNGSKDSCINLEHEIMDLDILIKKYDEYEIIMIGDTNCDIMRNNTHDRKIKKLIERLDMLCIDLIEVKNIDYTFHSTYKGKKTQSWIDHIIIKRENNLKIKNVKILFDELNGDTFPEILNNSDHLPVKITIKIKPEKYEKVVETINIAKKTKEPSPKWKNKHFVQLYQIYVHELLYDKNIPLIIFNMSYKSKEKDIDYLMSTLNDLIKEATNLTMVEFGVRGKTTHKHKKTKQWWDNELNTIHKNFKEYRRKMLNEKIQPSERLKWRQAYLKTKSFFRRKQRNKIRMIENSRNENLMLNFYNDRDKFRDEMKNTMKKKIVPDIELNLMTDQFNELFNKKIVKTVQGEINHLKIENENVIYEDLIKNEREVDFEYYTVNRIEIINIIDKLKNGKSVGNGGISNEAIKLANNNIMIYAIQKLIEKMINWQYVPNNFNIGKIIPIIKDEKGSLNDINNIRPLTISDTISNIYEKYMLYQIMKTHVEPKQQYGFRENSSCNHAIFTMKETIAHYNKKNKPVFACLIDASKAFDKINREILFMKLKTILIKPLWLSLRSYYKNSISYVSLNGEDGEMFKTTIGSKQGSPLSPKLFSIYVEGLIKELEESGIVCTINENDTGVVMYADDLTIMCDSEIKLNKALGICERYGFINEIKYNPKKTCYIVFGTKNQREKTYDIRMNDIPIDRTSQTKYLGVEITDNMMSLEHVAERRTKAISCSYALKKAGIFNKKIRGDYKGYIYKTYCRPVLRYGIESIKLNKKLRKKLESTEGYIVKKMSNCEQKSHHKAIQHAMNIETTESMINKTKLNFFKRLLDNEQTGEIIRYQIDQLRLNLNKLSSKSYIRELINLIDIHDLSEESIQNSVDAQVIYIDKTTEKNRNKSDVQEIKCLLNNPSYKNHKKLIEKTKAYEKKKKKVQNVEVSPFLNLLTT